MHVDEVNIVQSVRLVVAAVGGASAQASYTPPAGQSIDTLVEGYNANVEQVPADHAADIEAAHILERNKIGVEEADDGADSAPEEA